jgi:hypothetical protein
VTFSQEVSPEAQIPDEVVLREFVDRKPILAAFRKMLTDTASPLRAMWVYGPGGMGKSILLSRLMLECRSCKVRWLHAEWRDTERYSYLDLMRRLRDVSRRLDLFSLFTDQVNRFTETGYPTQINVDLGNITDVQILENGRIEQGGVEIHVGHVVRDLNITVVREDFDVGDMNARIELTRAFMPCLEALAGDRPIVLMLDALEKAHRGTMAWIFEELLDRIGRGRLPQVLLILAGRERASDADLARFRHCLRPHTLDLLREEDIQDFLRLRECTDEEVRLLARVILAESDRRPPTPLEVATFMTNYQRHKDYQYERTAL